MSMEYNSNFILSQTAAADLVKCRFVGFDGNYCGANAKAKGVTKFDVASGGQASLINKGIAIVETAGTFDAGAPIASTSVGKAVQASSVTAGFTLASGSVTVLSTAAQPTVDCTVAGGVLPQIVNGYAGEASTASGKFVKVVLI